MSAGRAFGLRVNEAPRGPQRGRRVGVPVRGFQRGRRVGMQLGGVQVGRGQAVRRGTLDPVFGGSNPPAPTNLRSRWTIRELRLAGQRVRTRDLSTAAFARWKADRSGDSGRRARTNR